MTKECIQNEYAFVFSFASEAWRGKAVKRVFLEVRPLWTIPILSTLPLPQLSSQLIVTRTHEREKNGWLRTQGRHTENRGKSKMPDMQWDKIAETQLKKNWANKKKYD